MADLRSCWQGITGLLTVAIRSFCGTMLLMLGVGVVLAVGAYCLLGRHQPWYGVIGGLVAMLEAILVGLVWAVKRATIMALVYGLKEYHIAKAAVRLIFERLLGVEGHRHPGERGGMVARALEQVPLAQAEKALRAAVKHVLDNSAGSGGMGGRAKRWLQGKLLRHIEAFTLARFRESGAEQGGVDLLKVQADLENRLDEALVAKLTGGLHLWTVLILVGLPAQILATVYIALALSK